MLTMNSYMVSKYIQGTVPPWTVYLLVIFSRALYLYSRIAFPLYIFSYRVPSGTVAFRRVLTSHPCIASSSSLLHSQRKGGIQGGHRVQSRSNALHTSRKAIHHLFLFTQCITDFIRRSRPPDRRHLSYLSSYFQYSCTYSFYLQVFNRSPSQSVCQHLLQTVFPDPRCPGVRQAPPWKDQVMPDDYMHRSEESPGTQDPEVIALC